MARAAARAPARPRRGDRRRPAGALLGLAALLRAARRAGPLRARVRGPPVGRAGPARLHRPPARVVAEATRSSSSRSPRPEIAIAARLRLAATRRRSPLEPLSDEAMDALLDGLRPGPARRAARARSSRRAEGVPLYAVETVRMLLDRGLLERSGDTYRPTGPIEELAVPETLHALLAARLDGLTPEERALVHDASVLGKTFTKQGVAALSGAGRGRGRAAPARPRPQGGAHASRPTRARRSAASSASSRTC